MFRHRHHILCARIGKKLCPLCRIKSFCPEHRNKFLVAKLLWLSIRLSVMLVLRRALDIHHPRIPLASKCRHTVYTPVNENSKLRLFVPLRNLIFCQRSPVILKMSRRNHLVDLRQVLCHIIHSRYPRFVLSCLSAFSHPCICPSSKFPSLAKIILPFRAVHISSHDQLLPVFFYLTLQSHCSFLSLPPRV